MDFIKRSHVILSHRVSYKADLVLTRKFRSLCNKSTKSVAQNRAFAVMGPSLWNDTPPALRSVMLQGISSASLRSLKTYFHHTCRCENSFYFFIFLKTRF